MPERTADKVIIACALTGGMTVPSQSSAIPVTPEEIVRDGVRAYEAGASILHLHVRDPQTGRPVADLDLFEQVLTGLRENTDAVLQTTTGGGAGMTIEERGAVLPRFRPETATFNAGSMNFGIFPVLRRDLGFADWEREYLEGTRDYVFRNTFADMTYIAGLMRESGTKPEIEVYDVGQINNVRRLLDEGLIDTPFHLQYVLGVLGGNTVEVDQLLHMLRTTERVIGKDSFTWSAAGVGYPGQFQLAGMCLMLGGHIRVGLEDNLRVSRTQRAESNADLVAKAVQLAELFDREPAKPDETRRLLGFKGTEAVAF